MSPIASNEEIMAEAKSGASASTDSRPDSKSQVEKEKISLKDRVCNYFVSEPEKEDLIEADIRRTRVTVARIDPWSAMKMGFVVSVALSLVIVVFTAVSWVIMDLFHVWANLESLLQTIGSQKFLNLIDFFRFSRVMGFSFIIGVLNVICLTMLFTIAAFIYNIASSLVGGLQVTISDE